MVLDSSVMPLSVCAVMEALANNRASSNRPCSEIMRDKVAKALPTSLELRPKLSRDNLRASRA